jgi:hypothetical protein
VAELRDPWPPTPEPRQELSDLLIKNRWVSDNIEQDATRELLADRANRHERPVRHLPTAAHVRKAPRVSKDGPALMDDAHGAARPWMRE